MNVDAKHQMERQLKHTSAAIDLIKVSQRTQHTSIKEALKKILRSISMLAGIEMKDTIKDRVKVVNKELMEKAKQIRENRERRDKENKDDSRGDCPHCGVREGELHKEGCEMLRKENKNE